MKSKIRCHAVTFGPEFPKPSGRRKAWPYVSEKEADVWLEGGLLFVRDKDANGNLGTVYSFHPAGVQMEPYQEDVGIVDEPKLQKVASR